MEASALEQALREHPDDPAAWLVYGDWLLEQGDVRGALIQLERRHVTARAAERPALRREIDALVAQHEPRWKAALPAGVLPQAWTHGFVTKVAVTWSDDAPAQIAEALREPFVTALRILSPLGDGEEEEEDYDDDGLPILPPPFALGGLAAIDLGRLGELALPYANIGAEGAREIAASTSLGGLAVLDLRYCRIGDPGLAALAASEHLGGVRRLHLQRNEITAAGAGALRRFGRLVELDLRYNAIGAEGAQALLDAPFIGALARLDLHRGDVSEAGARALARSTRLPPALRGYWRSMTP